MLPSSRNVVESIDVDAAIRAIGEPRRREILRLVWDGERSSGEIASHFDITGPAVSQHLRVLREAGLVNERREGTRHLFSANRLALRELRDQLAWMWDDGLADLKRMAETEARAVKRRGR
ncbi:MAG: winged helix-turn-helix transcriptional regulator [Actinobacteria bacterium]|nr:MAG: winged helix-turn-helix transcriptional regulator [Actinomycetota bacterium]